MTLNYQKTVKVPNGGSSTRLFTGLDETDDGAESQVVHVGFGGSRSTALVTVFNAGTTPTFTMELYGRCDPQGAWLELMSISETTNAVPVQGLGGTPGNVERVPVAAGTFPEMKVVVSAIGGTGVDLDVWLVTAAGS